MFEIWQILKMWAWFTWPIMGMGLVRSTITCSLFYPVFIYYCKMTSWWAGEIRGVKLARGRGVKTKKWKQSQKSRIQEEEKKNREVIHAGFATANSRKCRIQEDDKEKHEVIHAGLATAVGYLAFISSRWAEQHKRVCKRKFPINCWTKVVSFVTF